MGVRTLGSHRQIQDWELDEVEAFFRKLQVLLIFGGMGDKMVW